MANNTRIQRKTSKKTSNTDTIIATDIHWFVLTLSFYLDCKKCHWTNDPKVSQLIPSQGPRKLFSINVSYRLKMIISSNLFVTLAKPTSQELPPLPFLIASAHAAVNEFKISLKKTQEMIKLAEKTTAEQMPSIQCSIQVKNLNSKCESHKWWF